MSYAAVAEPINFKLRTDFAEPDPLILSCPLPAGPTGTQTYRTGSVGLATLAPGDGVGRVTLAAPCPVRLYVALYVSSADGMEIMERTTNAGITVDPGVGEFTLDLDQANATKGSDLAYNGTTHKIESTAGGVFLATLSVTVFII